MRSGKELVGLAILVYFSELREMISFHLVTVRFGNVSVSPKFVHIYVDIYLRNHDNSLCSDFIFRKQNGHLFDMPVMNSTSKILKRSLLEK